MADSRNIVIELKAQNGAATDSSRNGATSSDSTNPGQVLSTMLHPVKSLEKATIGQNVLAFQAYQYAKSQIVSVARYELGKYFSLTENYTAQQDMSNIMTAISKAASFGTSVVSGAMTGLQVGGVHGAIIGASIAAVGTGVSEAIGIRNRFIEQNRFLINTNLQSNFQLVRMGLVDGGRGTEN